MVSTLGTKHEPVQHNTRDNIRPLVRFGGASTYIGRARLERFRDVHGTSSRCARDKGPLCTRNTHECRTRNKEARER